MAATIRDVALRAGVSIATASRALSGSRRVSVANADRVVRAALSLDYRPNMVASSLRRQITHTIGLIIPQISNPFFPALVESIERQLENTARQLLLADSRLDVDIERQRLQSLVDRRVDGIMISPCDSLLSADGVRRTALQLPLVQIDRQIFGETTDWVGADNETGMRLVVEHLASLGIRSAVFAGAAPVSSTAQTRLTAFGTIAAEHGIRAEPALLGDFTVAWGAEVAQMLLEEAQLSDAIVCGNDLIAIGLLRQFLIAGVRVPDDVLVTGFDDIASAELSTPSLTTVRQPNETIAREAMRLLIERMEQPTAPVQRIAVTPELAVRASTVGAAHPC